MWPFVSFLSKMLFRFNQVVAFITTLLLFITNIPLYKYTHFIYPFISWWTLGCVHILPVTNNATMSICVHAFSYLLGIYLGVKLLGYMAILYFEVLQKCFPKWLHYFTTLPEMYEFSNCYISSPNTWYYLFVLAILMCMKGYLVVVLICISLMTNNVENLFMCLLATCITLDNFLFKSCAHLKTGFLKKNLFK